MLSSAGPHFLDRRPGRDTLGSAGIGEPVTVGARTDCDLAAGPIAAAVTPVACDPVVRPDRGDEVIARAVPERDVYLDVVAVPAAPDVLAGDRAVRVSDADREQ
jgi:hypothetical protein